MSEAGYATPAQIRSAFHDYLATEAVSEVSHEVLWRYLRHRGMTFRGANGKKERDAVWRALDSDPSIKRVRPGVFAAA